MSERNLPKELEEVIASAEKRSKEKQRTDLRVALSAASSEIERLAATSQGSAFGNYLIFGDMTGYHAIADRLSELGGELVNEKPTMEDITERKEQLIERWNNIDREGQSSEVNETD